MMCNDHSWDIKIIDFGLSFQWKKDMRSEVQALENGKIIGTPYYMSP
jgi:serine/threonine protein kinase